MVDVNRRHLGGSGYCLGIRRWPARCPREERRPLRNKMMGNQRPQGFGASPASGPLFQANTPLFLMRVWLVGWLALTPRLGSASLFLSFGLLRAPFALKCRFLLFAPFSVARDQGCDIRQIRAHIRRIWISQFHFSYMSDSFSYS